MSKRGNAEAVTVRDLRVGDVIEFDGSWGTVRSIERMGRSIDVITTAVTFLAPENMPIMRVAA